MIIHIFYLFRQFSSIFFCFHLNLSCCYCCYFFVVLIIFSCFSRIAVAIVHWWLKKICDFILNFHLLKAKGQSLVCNWTQIWTFKININALKVPVPTNELSMLKKTIKEHFERDYHLTKSVFTSVDQTKSVSLCGAAITGWPQKEWPITICSREKSKWSIDMIQKLLRR